MLNFNLEMVDFQFNFRRAAMLTLASLNSSRNRDGPESSPRSAFSKGPGPKRYSLKWSTPEGVGGGLIVLDTPFHTNFGRLLPVCIEADFFHGNTHRGAFFFRAMLHFSRSTRLSIS